MIHLDTHVLVWLYTHRAERLPPVVRLLLETEALGLSPMVELELTLLHDIGRLTSSAEDVLEALSSALPITVSSTRFSLVVHEAARLTWTRDPFDRLICGQASADRARLVTADGLIRERFPLAVWD